MRVYHFLGKQYGLESIEKRRLKISRITDLNDPFDFHAVYFPEKNLRKEFVRIIKELSSENGLLCFSKSWHNPLMWSHYADSHKGICLGFDVPDFPLNHVEYPHSRVDTTGMTVLTEDDVKTWICSKYKDWEYEDEVRAFFGLEDACPETGLYFADYSSDLHLREVMVGCKSDITRSDLDAVLGDEGEDIITFKTRPAFRTFHIVKNQNDKLWK